MISKPGKCSIIEHNRFSCWVYLHYIYIMLHIDDGAAKCTSVDFRIQSTQPEPTSTVNRTCGVCELGTVPCVVGVKRKGLALCSWRTEHNNSQDEVLFKWGPCGLSCRCGVAEARRL